jgi:methionyl-tRNA formyltransferase
MTADAPLRLGVFADGEVGLAILRLVIERAHPIVCVVLAAGAAPALVEVAEHPLVEHRLAAADLDVGALRALDLDLGLLAWWPMILGPEVIGATRLGFLNVHPSLLPHQRGKDPNFWAITERSPYGVTIHHVDVGIDSGDIAFQRPLDVGWEDTGETLHRRAMSAAIELVDEHLDRILRGNVPRQPQDPSEKGSFHRRSELDAASRIDLDGSYRARDLLDLLRARTYPGHPSAWFVDDGERYEVRVEVRRAPER